VSRFDVVLYDGRSAARHRVDVEVDGARVTITGDAMHATVAHDEIRADPPIPDVPRRLLLPGGAAIETTDHAAVTALWPNASAIARSAFWLESRASMAVVAVTVIACIVWLVVAQVLPLVAKPIAERISPEIEQTIGERTLKSLDAMLTQPSTLAPERRDAIRQKFAAFLDGEPGMDDVVLEFRKMGGANAFALPGRTIVVTDEMVASIHDDDELIAVLAHELGHLNGRHAMRMVLQQSGIAVLVTAVAGDAVGMTLLAAAMPAALLNARYSREFELEADDYAYALLYRHGRSLQPFADVLRRFAHDQRTADPHDPLLRYLDSHPDLDERIRRTEAAQQQFDANSKGKQ
jgi:Zn-dependent protease with chaperone function